MKSQIWGRGGGTGTFLIYKSIPNKLSLEDTSGRHKEMKTGLEFPRAKASFLAEKNQRSGQLFKPAIENKSTLTLQGQTNNNNNKKPDH